MAHVLPAQVSLSGSSFAENPAENLEESVRKRKRGVDPTAAAATGYISTHQQYIMETQYMCKLKTVSVYCVCKLTVEENTGQTVVEDLSLTWALLLGPTLLGVTLLERPRVNLIQVYYGLGGRIF